MFKKTKEILMKNLKWIIVFISLIIFVSIAEDILENEIYSIDTITYGFILKYLRNNMLTIILKIITNLASAFFLVTMCILSFIVIKNKRYSICITLNLVLVTAINLILKNIVQRPRPNEFRIIDETGYSFPSRAFYGKHGFLWFINILCI